MVFTAHSVYQWASQQARQIELSAPYRRTTEDAGGTSHTRQGVGCALINFLKQNIQDYEHTASVTRENFEELATKLSDFVEDIEDKVYAVGNSVSSQLDEAKRQCRELEQKLKE